MESATLFGRLFGHRPPANPTPLQPPSSPPPPAPARSATAPAESTVGGPPVTNGHDENDESYLWWGMPNPLRHIGNSGNLFAFNKSTDEALGMAPTPPTSVSNSSESSVPHGTAQVLRGTPVEARTIRFTQLTAPESDTVYSSSSHSPGQMCTASSERNRSNSMLDLTLAAAQSRTMAEAGPMSAGVVRPNALTSTVNATNSDGMSEYFQYYRSTLFSEVRTSQSPSADTADPDRRYPAVQRLSATSGSRIVPHHDRSASNPAAHPSWLAAGYRSNGSGASLPSASRGGSQLRVSTASRAYENAAGGIGVPPSPATITLRRSQETSALNSYALRSVSGPVNVPPLPPLCHPQDGIGLAHPAGSDHCVGNPASRLAASSTDSAGGQGFHGRVGEEEEEDDDEEDDEDDEEGDGVERDRYGFNKFNQYLSREDYLKFETQYGPIVEQRKAKWRQLFVASGGQWPGRSAKLKRYIRKGIPSEIRGPCWFHYSGAAQKYQEQPDTYRKWVRVYLREGKQSDFADVIERDLHRTFPDNEHFRIRLKAAQPPPPLTTGPDAATLPTNAGPEGCGETLLSAAAAACLSPITTSRPPMAQPTSLEARQKSCVESLRRILNVFTVYCPHVGYNQSLSYIVGLLLLFLSEEQAFWMLITIVEDLMPSGYFNLSQEYSLIDQEVLLSLLETKMPAVHRHLCRDDSIPHGLGGGSKGGHGNGGSGGPDVLPPVFLAMSHWFPLLFVDVLPIESVLRVWDCFFYEGSKVLFRVALALFKLNETTLLQTRDSLEQFQLVHEFPKRMIHCHHLMQVCFGRAVSLSRTNIGELRRQHHNRRRRRSMMLKLHKQKPTGAGRAATMTSSPSVRTRAPVYKNIASWTSER
ncbi:hypothetical protein IWQ60_009892 [Tieghemiomyces parasiticus]|uniref:Rab-GAP TBC domain-containing protein n=1 Tax=Tieghemiomyces parasiticus TaxID=78921 RepID=A0A9W7ZN15_9FUNG|nr:hypothetical protein IWQ60_009892 [Tieghemiomyces parasiticus]